MFSIDSFLELEKATIDKTRKELPGIAGTYPQIIDALLRIPQLILHRDPDLELKENTAFYYIHYLQAPSTTRVVFQCFETGHYLEALILMRHLLEAFIQMRYFRRHPQGLVQHVISKKRVSFRTMFDEFSPGYYQKYYGQQFSEAAHGMGMKFALRTIGEISPDGGSFHLGTRYNVDKATYVINNLTAIISGYFNQIDELLPGNRIGNENEFSDRFDGLRGWLNRALDELEKSKIGEIEVFDHYRRLFR